jgi:hypothetical protein
MHSAAEGSHRWGDIVLIDDGSLDNNSLGNLLGAATVRQEDMKSDEDQFTILN